MPPDERRVFGRYLLNSAIASGGMATVYFGRHVGPVGFSRTVAIKRLHPHRAQDPEIAGAMVDEARLTARIHHPNVVQTNDVVAIDGELLIVMDYVHGESLARVLSACAKRQLRPPPAIVSAIMVGVLRGLHAAHEARSETGEPLAIVHRDVSPQNVLVGADGVSRVLDFGVAKAANRLQETRDGALKGKLSYMSPEQATGRPLDRRCDVFAAGIVLFEALTATRLFNADDAGATIFKILHDPLPEIAPEVADPATIAILERALAKDAGDRYATADEFAGALEAAIPMATPREVGEWLASVAGEALDKRAEQVAYFERESADDLLLRAQPAPSVAPALDAPVAPAVPASTPASAERRISGRLVVALAAASVVAIGGVSYGLGAMRARPVVTTSSAVSTAGPSPESSSLEPDPASGPFAVPPLAAASAASSSSVTTSSRSHSTTKATPSKPGTARANAGCDNPFVFDENGIKHVKPGCVR